MWYCTFKEYRIQLAAVAVIGRMTALVSGKQYYRTEVLAISDLFEFSEESEFRVRDPRDASNFQVEDAVRIKVDLTCPRCDDCMTDIALELKNYVRLSNWAKVAEWVLGGYVSGLPAEELSPDGKSLSNVYTDRRFSIVWIDTNSYDTFCASLPREMLIGPLPTWVNVGHLKLGNRSLISVREHNCSCS